MMRQMAVYAGDPAQTPTRGGQAENPCKQGLACQPAVAALAPPASITVSFRLAADAVDHSLANALAATSRPPDQNLRPPKLL